MIEILDYAPYIFYAFMFVLTVFVVMFVHEMGHFMAARILRMPVKSVVIGRGRVIKSWTGKHQTRWDIRLWPIGAHVHLAGMEKEGEEQAPAAPEDSAAFPARSYRARMAVIFAGPAINLLTPFILFPLFYLAAGQPSGPPVIAGIEVGLAAEKAGLQAGDRFLSVDDQPFSNFQDIWRIAYGRGAVKSHYRVARGDEAFDLEFQPGWEEYDDDGITRANARFGISWHHTPFTLKSITSVDGVDTRKNEDLARQLLVRNLGREVLVGIKASNNKLPVFRVNLSRAFNTGLLDEDDDYYDSVYLGTEKGNFYLHHPPLESVIHGLSFAANLIRKISTIPFQLFPVDPTILADEYRVSVPETMVLNEVYKIIFKASLVSIFFALINLVPFPGMDGGYILTHTAQRLRKTPLTRKQKARIYVVSFIVIYAVISISNLDNLPRYIDSRLKKLHEVIYQK